MRLEFYIQSDYYCIILRFYFGKFIYNTQRDTPQNVGPLLPHIKFKF